MTIKEVVKKIQKIQKAKFTIRKEIHDYEGSDVHMIYLTCESDNLFDLKGKIPEEIIGVSCWVNEVIKERDNIRLCGQALEVEDYYVKEDWEEVKLENIEFC